MKSALGSTIESMMSLIVDGDCSCGSGAVRAHAVAKTTAHASAALEYLFTRVVYGRYETSSDGCICREPRRRRRGDAVRSTSDSRSRPDAAGTRTGTGPRTRRPRWRSTAGARSAAGRLGDRNGDAGDHGPRKILRDADGAEAGRRPGALRLRHEGIFRLRD